MSLLIEERAHSGRSEAFDVLPTDDQTIVLALAGDHDLDVARNGRWRSTVIRPGCISTTLAGEGSRLRVGGQGDGEYRTAHIYIPNSTFAATIDEHRRIGQRIDASLLSTVSLRDDTMRQALLALLAASRDGVADLYAEAAREWICVHFLCSAGALREHDLDARHPVSVGDRRLSRAIEAMHQRLAEPLTLDWLAREAGVSKYHFLRLFRGATGKTPWRYLDDLRMDVAHRLLRTTEMPVAEVARACGFLRANSFSTAFGRRFSLSPLTVRYAAQRRTVGKPPPATAP